jgi:ABC-2 type transport system ATP-binding protein
VVAQFVGQGADQGDIGHHFPNTDESIRGISSLEILRGVRSLLAEKNARAINIDATVIAEAPVLQPHIQSMRNKIAGALACDPSVIILDEPTAGLDVQGRAQLHDAIRELKNSGVTILLATHDMAEAESLCDRIGIMIRGRMAVIGSPAQITASGHAETRIIISTKNGCLLPGKDTKYARFLKQTDNYGIWLCSDTASAVMELLGEVQAGKDAVEDLRVERPSLEERFLELVEGGTRS